MIGFLRGRVVYKSDDQLLLDVQGVGYVIHCSDRTLAQIANGSSVQLFTDLLVREDLLQLYGFISLVEKEWYRLLTSVQGIGAKAALSILGALGPDGVSRAIAIGDWNAVKAARGIGPKTAQRVVNELKDKAPAVMALTPQVTIAPAEPDVASPALDLVIEAPKPQSQAPEMSHQMAQSDALSALGNLGYAPGDAAQAVAHALTEAPDLDSGALIKAALRHLAPKG